MDNENIREVGKTKLYIAVLIGTLIGYLLGYSICLRVSSIIYQPSIESQESTIHGLRTQIDKMRERYKLEEPTTIVKQI